MKISQTNVYEQNQFIDAYSSTILMNSINVTNITLTQSVIKTSLSTLNGSDIIVSNIDNPSNSTNSLISCSTDSSIYIDGLSNSQSQASLILLNNVTGSIANINTISSTSISNMIQIDDSYGLELTSLSISNVSSHTESIILIKDSSAFTMQNISVSDISQLAVILSNTYMSRAYNISFRNCLQGIRLIENSMMDIDLSTFINVGSSEVIYGGAIQAINSNVTINNSEFDLCQAKQGG